MFKLHCVADARRWLPYAVVMFVITGATQVYSSSQSITTEMQSPQISQISHPSLPAIGLQSEEFQAVTLHAKRIVLSPERSTLRADGNVQLLWSNLRMRAEQLILDGIHQTIDVPQSMTLSADDGSTLSGANLHYNLRTGVGEASDARAQIANLILRGKRMKFGRDTLTIYHGRFTGCSKHHPHYVLTARRIRIIKGRRMIADGINVRFYGLRLPTISHMRFSLGGRPLAREGMFANFYINSVDGIYIATRVRRNLSGGKNATWLTGIIGLSARELWRARLAIRKQWSIGEAWVGVSHKERISDKLTSRLLVDSTPEFGVAVYGVPLLGGRATISGHVSWGYYREWRGIKATSRRWNIQFGIDSQNQTATSWRWQWGAMLRYSRYDTGSLRLLRLYTALPMKFGSRINGNLSFIHHVQGGRTPFEFDDVDIPTEARWEGYIWL
ncbi:TPA: hypothetical protein EYP84_05285, partial [Candidatus Bipolaricaulota bacterium]|nr:hypothetical protein [Candidatus Bipolaricaulota bacterium]